MAERGYVDMGKVKVKLDLSRLETEFIVDSKWINSQEDVDLEVGWNEIVGAIMEMIDVKEEEFINDKLF